MATKGLGNEKGAKAKKMFGDVGNPGKAEKLKGFKGVNDTFAQINRVSKGGVSGADDVLPSN